jgi:hypothetical protein
MFQPSRVWVIRLEPGSCQFFGDIAVVEKILVSLEFVNSNENCLIPAVVGDDYLFCLAFYPL